MEKSDAELIRAFKRGDEKAFEKLVGRYAEKAYSLAIRLTRNAEDAEEVLQDVFVTVYRKLNGFEGKASFASWLYRVTMNAALMKLRKRSQDRSTPTDDLDQCSSIVWKPDSADLVRADQAAYHGELLKAMQSAIHKLPDDYRPVYIMRDIDGLTAREVSRVLDLSLAAVKSRLHRSRLALRKRLLTFYREYRNLNRGDKAAGA